MGSVPDNMFHPCCQTGYTVELVLKIKIKKSARHHTNPCLSVNLVFIHPQKSPCTNKSSM